MNDLTSEKIAKTLKGAGFFSKQKIEKATEAWNNDAIFFPNKDDFLFDWICSAFAKPNLKNFDDCCLFQLPYWILLSDLLQHYKMKTHFNSTRSATTIPTIHVNLVASVSTFLQHLYRTQLDQPKKRTEFISAAHLCIDILFSEQFALFYRPSLEQVSSTVDQLLTSLSLQINQCTTTHSDDELPALHQLCQLANVVLKKFNSQLVLAANQKKIFYLIAEKCLPKLLSVRYRITTVDGLEEEDKSNINRLITDIVCHSLFHADTVLEFTSVLKETQLDQETNASKSYVVKLFDTLENMMDDKDSVDQMLDAADVVPVLFSAFLKAFKQKHNSSTSAFQDIGRMAEFGLFIYLLKIIKRAEKRDVSIYLQSLCELLKELLSWNVYTARNDEIAKSQQGVLNSIADDVISYLDSPEKYRQSLVLALADMLLQIDISFIETRVGSLWPVMLNPENNAQDACLKFAKSILSTYSASRQIDVFVEDVIKHIRQVQSDSLYTILSKPMFSKEFLTKFSFSISKQLPAAQALGIFKTFEENLMLYVNEAPVNESATKKQKKNKNSAVSSRLPSPLIVAYFVEFINSLSLNQHQLRAFSEPVMSLFTNFIKPNIVQWIETKSELETTLLPAFQIHSTLTTAFFEIYTFKIEQKDQEWLSRSYLKVFGSNVNENSLGSYMSVAVCANVMLQHAYNAALSHSPSDSQPEELVNAVVDFVIEGSDNWYKTSQWNGSILGFENTNTVKLACWKLISDEWFEVVVRFIDSDKAEKIASIIYTSLTNDKKGSENITVQSLNTILLRSASFYEAKCFKNCNIPVILNLLVELFKSKLVKKSHNRLSKASAQLVSSIDTSKRISIVSEDITELSSLLNEDFMEMDVEPESTADTETVATLLKLLLLFPTEYYEKNERSQVSHLTTLIDIWSVASIGADPSARMKVSLMCRTLSLRFINFFSPDSIMGLDSEVLDWIVSSAETWPVDGNSELKALSTSLGPITDDLDFNILRKVIANVGTKITDARSLLYFEKTLTKRVDSLDKNTGIVSLGKVANIIRAVNSTLVNRKEPDIDLNNIVYASKSIAKISIYIISSLEHARISIVNILKEENMDDKVKAITKHKNDLDNIRCVLYLTRLLQNYAQIVGPIVDEVILSEKVSNTLTAFTSPLIQFLESVLSKNDDNYVVLQMTTEFIAAFCSILPRYRQAHTTKRILDVVWFVYSLVFNVGEQKSVEILQNAFASWIQSLSNEDYTIVLDTFIEQAEEEATNRINMEKEQHHLVYLSLYSHLLKNCNDSEKKRLRKQTSIVILKLSLIAGKTMSFKYIQQLVKLLLQLTGDQSYNFTDYDASLILSCLLQVAHPTALERFKSQLTREAVHTLFEDICAVLSNLITHHREQMAYLMPPYIAFIQSLLHCFKSTHISLVIGSNNKKRKQQQIDQKEDVTKYSCRTIPLLYGFAPLNDSSAQRLARLLTTIPQKQPSSIHFKNGKSVQTLQKTIAKHTPSILLEYFTIQSNPTTSIVQPSTKNVLTQGLYDILDLCSESDRSYILNCLDGPGKALFKDFYTAWKENHKYSGQ